MTDRKDGGAAFPSAHTGAPGMSLRDWFAGQALVGLLAFPGKVGGPIGPLSYEYADKMMEAREK